ncbi:hypothetical protein L7F22_055258 [Adiantum nelumboides]|nr:hypothetical protein [Adiantum nelumboides]
MASTGDEDIEWQEDNLTVYSNGAVHREPWTPAELTSACPCPSTPHDVASSDVTLNAGHGTSLRLFLPPTPPHSKLPILLYFHGGAFLHSSIRLRHQHANLSRLAAHVNALIVSVDYRLAPEHPFPAAYEDCYEALLWLDKQAKLGLSGEPWLANYADFSRCFLSGDSAGGTIVHYVGMQAVGHGSWQSEQEDRELKHVCLQGMLLFHPFFTCGREEEPPPADSKMAKIFKYINVTNDHPLVDPLSPKAPPLAAAPLPPACIFVAGDDALKQGAIVYYKGLVQAGKEAKLSIAEGETHVFHILKPASPNVIPLLDEAKDFITHYKDAV